MKEEKSTSLTLSDDVTVEGITSKETLIRDRFIISNRALRLARDLKTTLNKMAAIQGLFGVPGGKYLKRTYEHFENQIHILDGFDKSHKEDLKKFGLIREKDVKSLRGSGLGTYPQLVAKSNEDRSKRQELEEKVRKLEQEVVDMRDKVLLERERREKVEDSVKQLVITAKASADSMCEPYDDDEDYTSISPLEAVDPTSPLGLALAVRQALVPFIKIKS